MAQSESVSARPDIDIDADIDHLLRTYPPLTNDRHRVEFALRDGMVTVSGYVKSLATQNYVINEVSRIHGVRGLETTSFYNDDAIRRDVGRAIAPGIVARVEYGAVILGGNLPEGANVASMVRKIALVPGVHRVITGFTNHPAN
jgi:osmotically-inducible protein OsmY